MRKRPIGVTLLALVFLWIGCGGTLFFPVIVFSGGFSQLWEHLASGWIQSPLLMKIASVFLTSIWFLFYVAYAFIGFGLWKLKDWARKSVVIICAAEVVIGAIVSAFFLRPAGIAISILIGCVLPFGWVTWYLMRPRVRFAFGNWVSEEMPPPLSTRGKFVVWFAAVVLSAGLFACSVIFGAMAMMRSSGAYQITMATSQSSPCVINALGSPITPGVMLSGSTEETSLKGSAELSIPVHGPKGKGTLDVEAEKLDGNWKIKSLVLTQESNSTQIIPERSTSGCK